MRIFYAIGIQMSTLKTLIYIKLKKKIAINVGAIERVRPSDIEKICRKKLIV